MSDLPDFFHAPGCPCESDSTGYCSEAVDAEVTALREKLAGAERAVAAFRFYSDEFCQGDVTAEDAAHAMFDAVVAHRQQAEALAKALEDVLDHVSMSQWRENKWREVLKVYKASLTSPVH